MASIEEKYIFTTAEESMRAKDWAAGSHKPEPFHQLIITSDGPRIMDIIYPPAMDKIIDEPIVNALDHAVRTKTVKHIDITASPAGITIRNDGDGVECVIHRVATERLKKDMYVPSLIFGVPFQGENRNADGIVGGTNGLGVKLSNCFSNEFTVETVDAARGLKFKQTWRNHMEQSDAPIISKCRTKPYTQISFCPDYKLFGYDEFPAVLIDLVRTRAAFAAAYADFYCKGLIVSFNGTKMTCYKSKDIANMLGEYIAGCTIDAARAWDIHVSLAPSDTTFTYSNVNGIVVREGSHFRQITAQIAKHASEVATKRVGDKCKVSAPVVENMLSIFINAQVDNPSWTGQRKDKLTTDAKNFSAYILPDSMLKKISSRIADILAERYHEKKDKVAAKKKCDYEKYKPALKAGTRESAYCSLLAVEGDSAMTQVSIGITDTPGLGYSHYGIISLGGVIINVRKECSYIQTAAGGYYHMSKKLRENKFITALLEATGLNPKNKYDPASHTYNAEIASLNYGSIIACVDQDLDGKGNILGLILNMFDVFWPNLIDAGYIKWFSTPIIRAYPRSARELAREFHSRADYDMWEPTVDISKYTVNYYKGLGTHDRDEVVRMFKNFNKNLFTYTRDLRAHEMFEIYFGSDADKRKVKLSEPPADVAAAEDRGKIKCSAHLEVETDAYQRDNLERKLNHAIDGQNQAGRKILDGIIKTFSHDNTPIKVASLAGSIAKEENYHHGEASLASSITSRAFVAIGGVQVPLLVPRGSFGSRKKGGEDAAQPRYIHTQLNKRVVSLLFPAEDYYLLDFNFDEGARGEPKHFIPILPLAVLEFANVPSHGWKLELHARDVFEVIAMVKYAICSGTVSPIEPRVNTRGWTGAVRKIGGEEYSVGKYTFAKNEIHITELPLRIWTENYVSAIKAKSELNIIDTSNDLKIDIRAKITPDVLAIINSSGNANFDGFEEYFQLRNHMCSHINLMGSRGEVIHFEKYRDVIEYWYPYRRDLYARRIARQTQIETNKKNYYTQLIAYIDSGIGLAKVPEAEQIKMLESHGFPRINAAKLFHPGFERDINGLVYGASASYDYLLDLTDRKKSAESRAKYERELELCDSELSRLEFARSSGKFPGANMWLDELELIEKAIREGEATIWRYGDYKKHKFAE